MCIYIHTVYIYIYSHTYTCKYTHTLSYIYNQDVINVILFFPEIPCTNGESDVNFWYIIIFLIEMAILGYCPLSTSNLGTCNAHNVSCHFVFT